MPKSEVQEALSSYFSSFVSRSAELEKSFPSWYRVCRLDSGLYILSVTKVSEIMSCEQFVKSFYNLADFPHRPCFTLISLKYIWASKWDTKFLRSFCKIDLNIATRKYVLYPFYTFQTQISNFWPIKVLLNHFYFTLVGRNIGCHFQIWYFVSSSCCNL